MQQGHGGFCAVEAPADQTRNVPHSSWVSNGLSGCRLERESTSGDPSPASFVRRAALTDFRQIMCDPVVVRKPEGHPQVSATVTSGSTDGDATLRQVHFPAQSAKEATHGEGDDRVFPSTARL